MRHCEYCGKPLSADAAPRKRFCSAECERRSYYEGRRDKDHAKEEAEEGIPLREFPCERCGRLVRVMSKGGAEDCRSGGQRLRRRILRAML